MASQQTKFALGDLWCRFESSVCGEMWRKKMDNFTDKFGTFHKPSGKNPVEYSILYESGVTIRNSIERKDIKKMLKSLFNTVEHVNGIRNKKIYHLFVSDNGIAEGLPYNQNASQYYGDGKGEIFGIGVLFDWDDLMD